MTMPSTIHSSAIYNVGELPIWYGAQLSPSLKTAPFAFKVNEAGLVQLHDGGTTSDMISGYGADGYHFITSPPGASEWGNILAKKSLDGLVQLYGSLAGLDVLEIGGGTLYSAEQMVGALGAASVTLVDPAVVTASPDARITVRREYFSRTTDLPHSYKLIVSLNTLEHVPNPQDFLSCIQHWLADDGVVYLKMPECEESLEKGDLGLCVHEHLSYFTPGSLDALLSRAGLRRIAQANYQGALQILAAKAKPDAGAVCDGSEALVKAFSAKATAHIDRLRDFGMCNQGQPVAFIGASVGLSNILHLSGIGKMMDVEIFDGDALKTGRYLPGFEKPIKLTADVALEKHRNIFITPLNFFSEIKKQISSRPGMASVAIEAVFP